MPFYVVARDGERDGIICSWSQEIPEGNIKISFMGSSIPVAISGDTLTVDIEGAEDKESRITFILTGSDEVHIGDLKDNCFASVVLKMDGVNTTIFWLNVVIDSKIWFDLIHSSEPPELEPFKSSVEGLIYPEISTS